MSHRHASIRQRGSDYVVIDEGSSNGTFVGPVRLSPQAPRVVRSGDLIRVGRIWLRAGPRRRCCRHRTRISITKEIALALVASSPSAEGQLSCQRLFVSAGPDVGKELALLRSSTARTKHRSRAQRRSHARRSSWTPSRRHVEVIRRGTQIYARDLGSKNMARSLSGVRLEANWARHALASWPSHCWRSALSEFSFEDPQCRCASRDRSQQRRADEGRRLGRSSECRGPEKASACGSCCKRILSGTRPPVAQVPTRAPEPAKTTQGFRAVDAMIALVALIVIGLSTIKWTRLIWPFKAP